MFAVLDDAVGLVEHRHGAFERAGFVLDDWRENRARRGEVETRMLGVLDELELTELVESIPGLSALGAAVVLAETGDLARFTSARALVTHAGLCPQDNSSGSHRGRARLSGRGRPELRVAAWRAGWGAQHVNPVLSARYTQLTSRDRNRLSSGQARGACAATLLRWLQPWSPAGSSGTPTSPPDDAAPPRRPRTAPEPPLPDSVRARRGHERPGTPAGASGERARRSPGDLDPRVWISPLIMSSSPLCSPKPGYTLSGHRPRFALCRDEQSGETTREPLRAGRHAGCDAACLRPTPIRSGFAARCPLDAPSRGCGLAPRTSRAPSASLRDSASRCP